MELASFMNLLPYICTKTADGRKIGISHILGCCRYSELIKHMCEKLKKFAAAQFTKFKGG